MQFFVYDLPGCMEPAEYVRGIRVRGQLTFGFGPSPADGVARLGAKEIRTAHDYMPSDFARMTAKVAYSTAGAVKVVDPRRGRPVVVESIRGAEDEVGRWVGVAAQPRSIMSDVLHRVTIQVDGESGFMVGHVQFSADVGAPSDIVVLGRLDAPWVTVGGSVRAVTPWAPQRGSLSAANGSLKMKVRAQASVAAELLLFLSRSRKRRRACPPFPTHSLPESDPWLYDCPRE